MQIFFKMLSLLISKKYVQMTVALGLLLSLTSTVNAQKQTNYRVNITNELMQLCTLTPAQVVKIGPVVADFEKRRDSIYNKYHYSPGRLQKAVELNRWNYETTLIGMITPSQMGLVKAFDQRNPQLMTHNCSHVVSVKYLADAK